MSRRYLFGPIPSCVAAEDLLKERQAGHCLAFDLAGAADLTIKPGDSWDAVSSRFPSGWQPDFIALYLPCRTIPACLWAAPVPLVGFADRWKPAWHHLRQCLARCDLVVTDKAGVEVLARTGIHHAIVGNLSGRRRSLAEDNYADGPRDIDILVLLAEESSVCPETLERVARLSMRWRVRIDVVASGESYCQLLGRARIALPLATRNLGPGTGSEIERHVFEAALGGALLFQEVGNRAARDFFREQCVFFSRDNLESLLNYYLEHEEQRQTLARAAQIRARARSCEDSWQDILQRIEAACAMLGGKRATDDGLARGWSGSSRFFPLTPTCSGDLLDRSVEAVYSSDPLDPGLIPDLKTAVAENSDTGPLHNALGLLAAHAEWSAGDSASRARLGQEAAECFQHAAAVLPRSPVAALNAFEALVLSGSPYEALEQARTLLTQLDSTAVTKELIACQGDLPLAVLQSPEFRVQWERAAWANAGRPDAEAQAKRALLAWRLQTLLGDLTGELGHYYEAAVLQPDLRSTHAALGFALARQGKYSEAIPHLRQATAENPFDRQAARALFDALGQAGHEDQQRRFAQEQRLLSRAAPHLVRPEPWFMQAPPPGHELVSIILVCCNQLALTRQCLESLLRHTRVPYELLLVDNGSTDGTLAYLQEMQRCAGPERVVVIRNELNLGFSAACDKGIAVAAGQYVVLLNHDTVLTPRWLDGLLSLALSGWPSMGMVGPMSNSAPGPQQVSAKYGSLDDLNQFADCRRRGYAGQALKVGTLPGFCRLIRRDVLEATGGFIPQGPCLEEDDELGRRVRDAGYHLGVALDVFVHHFGSRTFVGEECPGSSSGNSPVALPWPPLTPQEGTVVAAAVSVERPADAAGGASAPADRSSEKWEPVTGQKQREIGWFGPYRILKVLGSGGMGVVFHAEDPVLKRAVALKVMRPALQANRVAKQRFLREARAAAAVEHDHIVTIYQVGEAASGPFLAMQLLKGESLEDRLRRRQRLPLPEVLRIGWETAHGLAAAHERGLIHRDIKPGNIWLEVVSAKNVPQGRTGGDNHLRDRVKILDFGVAIALDGESVTEETDGAAATANSSPDPLTLHGTIVGTPAYVSPEQVTRQAVDHRSDLFSLGCVLYRMATGHLPFKGEDTAQTLLAIRSHDPELPRALNPGLPAELEGLILRLLAKDPPDRIQSAGDVATSLEALGSGLRVRPRHGRFNSRPA